MPAVNTVSGPIDTSELGSTLMHEHIMVQSPGVKDNFAVYDRSAEDPDRRPEELLDVESAA